MMITMLLGSLRPQQGLAITVACPLQHTCAKSTNANANDRPSRLTQPRRHLLLAYHLPVPAYVYHWVKASGRTSVRSRSTVSTKRGDVPLAASFMASAEERGWRAVWAVT